MSGFSGVGDAAPWTSYTPVVTASGGALTTTSAVGFWKRVGKTIFVRVSLTITTNGTGAGHIIFTLPANAKTDTRVFNVGLNNSNGTFLMCYSDTANANKALLFKLADASYPGGDGFVLHTSLTYEEA